MRTLIQPANEEAILRDLGNKINRVRLNRNLTQAQASFEAGVSKRTLERLEAGESIQLVSFLRILRTLGLLNEFHSLFPEPDISPMVQLQLRKKRRQRASRRNTDADAMLVEEKWSWGK